MKIYNLNRSPTGNLVFRYMNTQTGISHVRKVFKTAFEAAIDFDLLEQMRILLKDSEGSFRVAQTYGLEGSNLFLEDVRGTDLKFLYEQNRKMRREVRTKLEEGMNQIFRSISQKKLNDIHVYSSSEGPLPTMTIVFPRDGKPLSVCFCPENIVLEPKGGIVLIDP